MKSHTIIGGGGTRLHVDETGNPNGKAILTPALPSFSLDKRSSWAGECSSAYSAGTRGGSI